MKKTPSRIAVQIQRENCLILFKVQILGSYWKSHSRIAVQIQRENGALQARESKMEVEDGSPQARPQENKRGDEEKLARRRRAKGTLNENEEKVARRRRPRKNSKIRGIIKNFLDSHL